MALAQAGDTGQEGIDVKQRQKAHKVSVFPGFQCLVDHVGICHHIFMGEQNPLGVSRGA